MGPQNPFSSYYNNHLCNKEIRAIFGFTSFFRYNVQFDVHFSKKPSNLPSNNPPSCRTQAAKTSKSKPGHITAFQV